MFYASRLTFFSVFYSLFLISNVQCSNCTIGGVDLTPLDSTWISMSDDGNITYKISLCKPVLANGQSDQNCHGDTSVCMHYKNGTVLSAGNFSTETKSSQGNDKGELWLVMTGDKCLASPRDNMSTLLGLKCGPTLGGPKFLEHSYCVNYFLWETDILCTGNNKPISEVKCYLFDDDGNRYDLSPLAKKKGGYHAVSSDSETEIYINICRDIIPDGETANCTAGAGACAKVVTGTGNDRKVVTLSAGKVTDSLKLATDKRLTLHYGSDTTPEHCTYPPSTTINFVCPNREGSKDPILESDFNCQYVINWETEYACPEAKLTNKSCILTKEEADIDIDLTPLRNPPGSDHPYKVNYTDSDGTSYVVFLNICEELNIQCPDEDHKKNIAACQQKPGPNDADFGKSMGSIHETELRYADGDLTLTYKGGDLCHHNSQQRTTVINFICNKNAVNDGKGQPVFADDDDCTYIFDWETKYACTEHPVGEECSVSYGGNNYDLSRLVRTEANWVALQSLRDEDPGSYFINVCHDVLSHAATSGCKQGSAVCYKNGEVTRSLGQYVSAPVYQPSSESIQLTYTGGDSCGDNKHISSVINFYCKPAAGHLESRPTLVQKSADGCVYEFEWQTAAACKLGHYNGSECKVSDDTDGFTFDLSPLKKTGEFYKVTNDLNFDFLLNVCGPVKGTKCDSSNITNPGICQVKKQQEASDSYVLGQYSSNLQYFDGLIKLIYSGGTPYNDAGHTPRTSEIAFLCNSTVGVGKPQYMSELNHTYLFEWYTSYACPEQAIECTATDPNTKAEYDLSSLSHSSSEGNWMVAGDDSKTYYINVCRKLNTVRVETGCAPSAAVCRTKLENGQEKIDLPDMGHVTSDLTVKGEGRLELTYTSTALCNNTSNYVTHLQFVCEKSASVTSPNAPKQDGPCEYTILWNTQAACPLAREVEAESCTIKDPNSDFVFNLQPLSKKQGFYNVSTQDATFKLNICGNLSSDVCGSAASVCSIGKDGAKTVLSSKSGKLQFSEAGHISLLYEGAQRLSNGQKVDVIINFECDRTIDISSPEFLRKDTALYIFTYKTALACPPATVDCLVQDGAGHEYDLRTLYKPDGWTSYDVGNGQTYIINICGPISNSTGNNCPAGPIGGCQLASNGNTYNMGYIQSKPVARPDGTLSLRYMNGDLCHNGTQNEAHRSTRINFFCSGVNGGLMFLTETETCEYVFTWNTPAACPLQKTYGSQCKVMEPLFNFEFNLNPLRKNDGFDYHIKDGEYEYILNICGALNEGGRCGDKFTAACQTKPQDASFTSVDAGKANSTLVYSGGELTLVLPGGKDNCHGTYTRETIIKFTCDHSTDGKNGGPKFIEESPNCQYLFDWPTRYACPPFNTGECTTRSPAGAVYDLTSLGHTSDNYETIDALQNKRYVINVCRSLVHKKDTTCPYNAAACMIDTNSTDPTKKYHSIGQVNSHEVQVINNKLLLIYDQGDACEKNQSQRYTTHIHLMCDPNAMDSSPTGHFMVGDCAHHFMWSTPAACPISGTEPVPTTNATCKLTSPVTGKVIDLTPLKIISGKGWQVSDGENHLYEFNVCGPVLGSKCGNTSSLMGVCQSEKDGQKRAYNAGNIVSDIYYDDGIVILNYTGGERCHGGQYQRNTIISFVCGSASIGEPVYIDETLDCTYYIAWHTHMVCEDEIICKVDVDDRTQLDLTPLANMPYQVVRSTENNELYYLSVCQPLKPIPQTLCPAGASSCLVMPGAILSLGKAHSSPTWNKEGKEVVMIYDGGSRCDEHPELNYSTRIIFKCQPGPHRGTPVFVSIVRCEYLFQWDTNVVCFDETPPKPTDFCGYKDPQTLAVYNFTSLHALSPYKVTDRNGKDFFINMCGAAEPTSTTSCNKAMVCSNGISYGEPRNYQVVKESGGLKLTYAAGEKCEDGKTAQSHIYLQCDRNAGIGTPEFLLELDCYAVFTWKTSEVCPPVDDTCYTVIDGHLYDLTMLTRDTGSWVETDTEGNKYWINVCASVHDSPCDKDVGVCRQSKGGKPASLGRASSAQQLQMKNGSLVLEYTEGDAVCTDSKRRSNNPSSRTVINFKCGKTYGGPVFVPRKQNAGDCVFEFDWETKLACRVKKEEVNIVDGIVKDPRSGGAINLNPLLHKSFDCNKSDDSGGMMTYTIQLDGKSVYCKDGAVCQQKNNKNQYRVLGLFSQKKLYMDDDILEVEYNSTEFCKDNDILEVEYNSTEFCKDSKSQRPVSSVIQFHCNRTAPLTTGPELLYSSKDCMYVFSWETQVACINVSVEIPTEGPVNGPNAASSGKGLQSKTIGAIVGVFLGAIVLCILLVVFHSADRRAAFVNRLRRIVGHRSSEYTQLSSESANLLAEEEEVLTMNDPAEPDSSSRETEPIVTVEPRSYHDDSDVDLLA